MSEQEVALELAKLVAEKELDMRKQDAPRDYWFSLFRECLSVVREAGAPPAK